MSIVSNISIAFFSDCNTFATPKRLYLYSSKVSFMKNRAALPDQLASPFGLSLMVPTGLETAVHNSFGAQ